MLPTNNSLLWLRISQRVVFKTALMVWKCVHGVAPAYLSDLCVPAIAISGRQYLRSAATGTLLVPRARTATGQRSFAVNGPATWNRLPPALWSSDLSESAFKRALKTHLFSTARRRVGDGSVGHGSVDHMGRHYSMGHMGHWSVGSDPRPIIYFNIWNVCVAVPYSRINCVCNDKWYSYRSRPSRPMLHWTQWYSSMVPWSWL